MVPTLLLHPDVERHVGLLEQVVTVGDPHPVMSYDDHTGTFSGFPARVASNDDPT